MALIRPPFALQAASRAERGDKKISEDGFGEHGAPLPRARKGLDPHGLSAAIGKNLRHVRGLRAFSLDQLAKLSGVSRAMLSQIETGKSAPTISVLWKIAVALDVPIGRLLPVQTLPAFIVRRGDTPAAPSRDGSAARRALHRLDANPGFQVFEIALTVAGAGAVENAAPGGRALLVVKKGAVAFAANNEPPVALGEGDAVTFASDQPHSFRNAGAEPAEVYLVSASPNLGSGQISNI